jgi:glycine hydroxymethyltransferase
MHIIAAKAVAFKEAMRPSFKSYQKQVVKNAKKLAQELSRRGLRIVSGGTDTHLLLVDLRSKNITGKDAAHLLDRAGITTNKNQIPYDPQSPFLTSGLRLGTPAVTTRGMKEPEMKLIAELISLVLTRRGSEEKIKLVRRQVRRLTEKFPLYKFLRANNDA